MQADALRQLSDWEGDIRARELAEKRRVAPGWLDVDESARMLVPTRIDSPPEHRMQGMEATGNATEEEDDGAEIDRAFGKMALR
jgi:hypothetical protein